MRTRRRLLREPECRRPGGLRGAEPPVPYLQCCLCEKPLGCLQSILRLYLSDHLWRRVRDLFGMWLYIYTKKIQKKENIKKWFCSYIGVNPYKTPPTALRLERPTARGVTGDSVPRRNAPLNYFLYCVLGCCVLGSCVLGSWALGLGITHALQFLGHSSMLCGRWCLCVATESCL
jgi:hypothetical protein